MSKRKSTTKKVRVSAKAKAKVQSQTKVSNKAKHDGLLRELKPFAKEVNARFKSAAQMEGKADDHRLAAAIKLAEAKEKCEAQKLNFKKWCDEFITEQSYETVRKLATVGQSDNPAMALEDMRSKNKKANKKLRESKKGVGQKSLSAPSKKVDPFIHAEQTLLGLDDKVREAALSSVAHKDGMKVIDKKEYNRLVKAAEGKPAATVASDASVTEMLKAFDGLKASDKMTFMAQAARKIGVKLVNALDGSEIEAPENDMPAFLKRSKKGGKKSK